MTAWFLILAYTATATYPTGTHVQRVYTSEQVCKSLGQKEADSFANMAHVKNITFSCTKTQPKANPAVLPPRPVRTIR